jgi:hypothetical protein
MDRQTGHRPGHGQSQGDPEQLSRAQGDPARSTSTTSSRTTSSRSCSRRASPRRCRASRSWPAHPYGAPRRAPPSRSTWPRAPRRSCSTAGTSSPRTSRPSGPDVLRHRVTLTYEAEAEEITADQWCAASSRPSRSPERQRVGRDPEGAPQEAAQDRDPHGAARQRAARGRYASVFKGRGLAFDEVRDVPARRRRPLHRLERHRPHQRPAREGLSRGARDDRDAPRRQLGLAAISARAAMQARARGRGRAVLAFSAIKNNDRVGLVLFTDDVEKVIAPRKGPRT